MKKKSILFILALCVCGLLHRYSMSPKSVTVVRNDYDGEERTYEIYYQKEDKQYESFTLPVPPRMYTKEELDTLSAELLAVLPDRILGENADLEHVNKPLLLTDSYADYPFSVAWDSSDSEVLDRMGNPNPELGPEPAVCELTAELVCGEYRCSRTIPVRVSGQELSEKELFEEQLRRQMSEYLSAFPAESRIEFPETVNGVFVYGSVPNPLLALMWPCAGLLALWFYKAHQAENRRKEEEEKKEYLRQAFPMFLNQLVLFLSAGITVRQACSLVEDNMRHAGKPHYKLLCGYLEEMDREMENGVSECDAYQNFGKRCRDSDYRKLVSLLIQTVTVGTKGLLDHLLEMEEEAFEKRKEQAQKFGERASTKLLLPMILLLAVVMVLLMVPAFMSMGI